MQSFPANCEGKLLKVRVREVSPEAPYARQRCLFVETLVDTNAVPLKRVIFSGLFISMQNSRMIAFPFNRQLIQVHKSNQVITTSQMDWISQLECFPLVLEKIFSFLNIATVLEAVKVSTTWKQLITQHVQWKRPWKNIRRLSQHGLEDLNFKNPVHSKRELGARC